MRRGLLWIAMLVAVLALAVGSAADDDYVEMLKDKVGYYRVTTGRFAPIYEPLARQMVVDYGLKDGVAVDVGSSCSPFGIYLAEMTDMRVYCLDIDPWSMRLLGVLVDRAELTGRAIPVEGDALNMPFKDSFADLVFSRACIPFVDDQVQFMRECYRILKPGGVGYVGHGGFGRLLEPQVRQKLVEWRLGWGEKRKRPRGWRGPKEGMVDLAQDAGIDNYRLVKEPDVGWWLEMRKPAHSENR